MSVRLAVNAFRASSPSAAAAAAAGARHRLPRALPRCAAASPQVSPSLTFARYASGAHHEESFPAFTNRYVAFFDSVQDVFELQRGLNNCFAHDLVPSPDIIEAALRAARRVDDYSTAVRIFEGLKEKVENKSQYEAYLKELEPVRKELGWSPHSF